MKHTRIHLRSILNYAKSANRFAWRSAKAIARFTLVQVLIFCICFLPVMPLRGGFGDSYGNFTIWTDAGRATHGFSIETLSSGGQYYPIGSGSAMLMVGGTRITGNIQGSGSEMIIRDTTTGDTFQLPNTEGTGDLVIPPGAWGGNTLYFSVPFERSADSFAVRHPDGATYLANTTLTYQVVWDEGFGQWTTEMICTGWAQFDPAQPFRLIDLTTSEQFTENESYAGWGAAGTWETLPASEPIPVHNVTIYLPRDEAGNAFTIHSQAPGGSEMLGFATADPVTTTNSFSTTDGTWFTADQEAPLNLAKISAVIGEGMTFWVTRDYDGADPQSDNGTRCYLDPEFPQAEEPLTWALAGFTPIPMVLRDFYIATSLGSEPWWGNGIFIYQPGGFSPIIDSSSSVSSIPDVDYLGNDHSFYYWTHQAYVRPNQPYWIAYPNGNVYASSTTNPNDYQWTMLTSNPYENTATGGWTPLNGVPPPGAGNDLLRIFIPESRLGRDIRLYRGHPWDGNSNEIESTLAPFVDIITNPWNSEMRFANSIMIEGGGSYTAADPLGWFLLDVDANEVKELQAGDNDLREWHGAEGSVTVQISLSRWSHVLTMRCEDGSEFPLVNKSWSQGDISSISGEAHFNPYYFFDASFSARSGLNWFVWDETMQEASPTNTFYLGDWIVAPPVEITAVTEVTEGEFAGNHQVLVRPLETQDSAFVVERLAPGRQWEHVATSMTSLRTAADIESFQIPIPIGSGPVRFRARSFFGGVYSQYSNEVSIAYTAPSADTDGDGLPDQWEVAWGLNPNVADSHLRYYGMETALASFQANAEPPPPGETSTAAAWTGTRRVHLWQTPYYDGSSNPQLHPSHYVLTWDLPDPALTGNVQIRVESEEGQWDTQSTVAVTDQYVRVAAPARSIDPVKIRKRLVVGEHEEFNYKLIGAVTSNESQVKVRLRTRSRSIYRMNPAIVQLFPYNGFTTGPTHLRFKKSVTMSEWNYEDTDPEGEFKDTGTHTDATIVDTATGKTTWKAQKAWSYDSLQKFYGNTPADSNRFTGESAIVKTGYSEEVDTFQSISPIPSDPHIRVAPQGLPNYISTNTFGSGKPADPTIWTNTETDKTYSRGLIPQTVSTTTSGEKHSRNQSTNNNGFLITDVGTENKQEWTDEDTDGTSTFSWKKETVRSESSGTVSVDGGPPTPTTTLESVNHLFRNNSATQRSASPSYHQQVWGSSTWGSKITIKLSEPYSDLSFLTDIALALPPVLQSPSIWEDRFEDSYSLYETQTLNNTTYPRHDLTQGGIVAESRLTERGLYGEVMKSEYWLECNDCLPGGTAVAIETWEQESSFGKTFTGNVRTITLPIGAKEGRATKSIVYDSMVHPGVWNQTRRVSLVPIDIVAVFGYGETGKELTKGYLERAKTTKSGNVYQIKGKGSDGNPRTYTVLLGTTEGELKMGLSSPGCFVVFDGHSNMGMGPFFDSTKIKRLQDFTNFGNPKTAINWEYWVDGGGPEHPPYYPNLTTIHHSEVAAAVVNYDVPNLDQADKLRYPNSDGKVAGDTFTKTGSGRAQRHFNRGGNNHYLIVNGGSADLPLVNCDSFFYNICNSGRDYIEVFDRGTFFYTIDECGASSTSKAFIESIIAGKRGVSVLAAINAEEDVNKMIR